MTRTGTMTGRLGTVFLPIALAIFSACANPREAGIVDLTGTWEWSAGLRPGDRSPRGWREVQIPHNFKNDLEGDAARDWITLRRPLPASLDESLRRGEAVSFYSGLVSDVSRFYLNDRLFGGQGSVEPYRSGLYRIVLEGLPRPTPDAAANGTLPTTAYLYLALRSPGDRPLHFEGPEIYAGPTPAVFSRFYYRELLILSVAFLLGVVSLYHFQLAWRLPAESHNFYYAVFTLAMGGWFFFRSMTRDLIFGEHVLLRVRIEYTALFILGPFFILFMKSLFDRALSRFALFLVGVVTLLTVAVWIFSYPLMKTALQFWQLSALVCIVYMLVLIGRALWRKNRDAYYISAGIILILVLGAYDILASFLGVPTVAASRFGMPIFVLSTTALLTNRFVHMYNRASVLNENLEIIVNERTSQLSHAKQRAEEGSRSKSEFLANMSHEIRTPMTAIVGMAELLSESEMPEEERRYVATLRNSSRNLLGLIDDILDVSRIEAGRLELEQVEFELEEPVADAADMFLGTALAKGVAISTEIDPTLPRWVRGDPGRLRQVLVNLIGNAVKFTDRGEIALRAYPAKPAGEAGAPGQGEVAIEFSVRDTGIGIPPEKWDAIFEKFSQSDTSITRRFGGTGLGLTISANLVQMMGGRIWVESIPDRGSTFYFTAQLRSADEERPAAKTEDPEVAPVPSDPRILLVEDNIDNRFLFEALFRKDPVSIRTAEDGAEAVRLFESGSFDIIFMDIQMPVMDGLSATRRIRELEAGGANDGRRTPIVALSAGAHEAEIKNSLAAGCDAHVPKPFAKQDILDALREFAGG